MLKRTVDYSLYDLTGTARPGAKVLFIFTGSYTNLGHVQAGIFESIADGNGNGSIDLFVNESGNINSTFICKLDCGTQFNFSLPAGDTPISLSLLRQTGTVVWDDIIPPAPTSADLTITDLTDTSLRIKLVKCTDNRTPQSKLTYELFTYQGENLNGLLDTITNTLIHGTSHGVQIDVSYFDIDWLRTGETTFFNVICRDESGNIFLYNQKQETTLLVIDTSIRIVDEDFLLGIGETRTLIVEMTVADEFNEGILFTSSDPLIASVDADGVVTGVAEGTVTITAASVAEPTVKDFVSVEVGVFVDPVIEVLSVSVSPSVVNIQAGGTMQFYASVQATGGASEAVTWASSDVAVATVDANGLVTIVGAAGGSCTITATSVFDPTKSGVATLTVVAVYVDTDSIAGDLVSLTALYNNTAGANWTNNTGWLVGNPSNDWYGITVNAAGRVTNVDLFKNNLVGVLPQELGNLKWVDK